MKKISWIVITLAIVACGNNKDKSETKKETTTVPDSTTTISPNVTKIDTITSLQGIPANAPTTMFNAPNHNIYEVTLVDDSPDAAESVEAEAALNSKPTISAVLIEKPANYRW